MSEYNEYISMEEERGRLLASAQIAIDIFELECGEMCPDFEIDPIVNYEDIRGI